MSGKINNYQLGQGGVNVTKEPLHLSDDELVQGQNVEIATDSTVGGVGALTKRGGLAVLNGSALSGSVTGMVALPLQTTFTRTLYCGLGTAASNTWATTTDGTTFTGIATPSRATITASSDYNTFGTSAFSGNRGTGSYSTYLIYPGSNYTSSLASPATNTSLDMDMWDGAIASELFRLPIGASSSDGNYAFTISDVLVANSTVYFAVHDPTNSGTLKGRVLSLDVTTGTIQQIAQTFGSNSNQISGGAPACLAYYQGKLWVGLNNGDGTANAGKVVSCYPGIDTAWTVDTAALPGWPHSLLPFQGNLYVATHGNATNDAAVYVRTSSTGLWTSSDTQTTSGIDYYASLVSYNSELYAVVFSDGGADLQKIRKFSAGSWTTDRDVAASDGGGTAFHVGNAVVYNSDLYISFIATSAGNTDGFILKKHSGTWSKVSTGNYTGRLGVLLVKS